MNAARLQLELFVWVGEGKQVSRAATTRDCFRCDRDSLQSATMLMEAIIVIRQDCNVSLMHSSQWP